MSTFTIRTNTMARQIVSFMLVWDIWLASIERVQMGPTRRIIKEDLGNPIDSDTWTYLDYIEPEFNGSKAWTADDFTDDGLQGFYTKPNRPVSKGWSFANIGEVPWAGVLIGGIDTVQTCGAVVLTTKHTMAPCACVRTFLVTLWQKRDPDLKDPLPRQEDDLSVPVALIMNTDRFTGEEMKNAFRAVLGGTDKRTIIPLLRFLLEKVPWRGDENCRNALNIRKASNNALFKYYFAIMEFTPEAPAGTELPWPPLSMAVYEGFNKFHYAKSDDGRVLELTLPNRIDNTTRLLSYYSFQFKPRDAEDRDIRDNFNQKSQINNRLIELPVLVCEQEACVLLPNFDHLNAILTLSGEHLNLLCTCDFDWSTYPMLHDQDQGVLLKSNVWGGNLGSPLVHNGDLMGWLLNPIGQEGADSGRRPSLARLFDDKAIDFVQQVIPALKPGNRPVINDRNRAQYAIHDHKLFLPDPDLAKSEVDLMGWSLLGKSRYHRRLWTKSGLDGISPGSWVLTVTVIQVLLEKCC